MSFLRIAKRKRSQICQSLRRFSSSSIQTQERRSSSGGELLDLLSKFELRRSQSTPPQKPPQTSNEYIMNLMEKSFARNKPTTQQSSQEELVQRSILAETRKSLLKQNPRTWTQGQVYAPHDLSAVEASKYAVIRRKPTRDVFDLLGTNPIKHYKNFALLSQFVTETGRIKPASETGLRPVNQRRLAKAIRRAIGLGLMPSVYKHPEVLGEVVGLVRGVGR